MLFHQVVQTTKSFIHNGCGETTMHNCGMTTHILAQRDDAGELPPLLVKRAKHVLQ